ncbi:MAG: hypothetical protein ACR2QR_13730 [Woeseiaceae bacterium]
MRASKFKQLVWVYLLATVVYGIFALLLLFPVHPISLTGWGIWFAATLPVALIGEFIGSALFNNRTGVALDADTAQVSITRIAYGVFVAIVVMLIVLLVASELDLFSNAFWDRHISRNW